VTGEQAVPAMQALVGATGSVTKSQQLMNTALNISAQTAIDVTEVAKGLSQAYLGNRKALNQYNTGLTKTELQTISFTDLQLRLDKIFAGSATAAAATYSGQMLILAENAEQAKEVIGKGLVDSFVLLAGEGGLPSATTAMQDFATATSEATLGAASLIDKLTQKLSTGGFNFLGLIPVLGGYIGPGGVLDKLRQEGRKVTTQNMGAPGAISGKVPAGAAYFAAQEKADKAALDRANALKKIENDRLKNLKKIASEAAKKLALDKASAFLNKANQIFDNERIQLTAAAMAKQTEEDKVRIRLKTEIMDLEEAIAEGNVQGAAKFAAMITEDARLLGVLRANAFSLSSVPDPFAAWMVSLQGALAALMAVTNFVPEVSDVPENAGGVNKPNYGAFTSSFNAGQFRMGEERSMREYLALPKLAEGGIVNSATIAMIGEAGPEAVVPLDRMGSMGNVTYNIYASGIGDQAIAQVVQNTLQELNRYGNSTTYAGAL
jgi:hypothetical protein